MTTLSALIGSGSLRSRRGWAGARLGRATTCRLFEPVLPRASDDLPLIRTRPQAATDAESAAPADSRLSKAALSPHAQTQIQLDLGDVAFSARVVPATGEPGADASPQVAWPVGSSVTCDAV